MTHLAKSSVLLIGTLVVCIAVIIFMHKVDEQGIRSGRTLPRGATQIKDVGPGWYEFSYKGKQILFYHDGVGESQRTAMVRID